MYKPDRYFYPAIFTHEEDGQFSVEFPDLDCATCAESEEKAVVSAKELLAVHMNGLEEDNETIPEPSPIGKIKLSQNDKAVMVDVFMPKFRKQNVEYTKPDIGYPDTSYKYNNVFEHL